MTNFASGSFLLFFSVVFFATFILKNPRLKKLMLLGASLYFYATINLGFCLLLVVLGSFNYLMGRARPDHGRDEPARLWLAVALGGNLVVLIFYKYAGFLITDVWPGDLSQTAAQRFFDQIVLPLGISFYTFQNLSYILEVYYRRYPPCESFADYLLYISFFPQLLSGPIVRPQQFLPQLQDNPTVDFETRMSGFALFLQGVAKKIFFADVIGRTIVSPAFAQPELFHPAFLVFALYAFSIQIYMDLSGYTDMARGSARLLGYELPENFRSPYAATSVGNFWQRWHITMSSFFRDYVFFSLGGSRRGNAYVNVVITFVAIGIWHDAGWNFVVYGFCHGGMVAFERWRRRRHEAAGRPPAVPTWWGTLASIVFVFSFVSFTRVLFRGESLASAGDYLGAIATAPGDLLPPVWLGYAAAGLGLALHYLPPARREAMRGRFSALPSVVQAAVAVVVIYAAVAISAGSPGFIYFQF